MTALIDLTKQALHIASALMETGGEITPELDLVLTQHETQLAQKADAFSFLMERLESEEGLWRKRRVECDRLVQSYKLVQERLKDRVKTALVTMQKFEIEGEYKRLKLIPTKGSVVINEGLLADEFKKIEITSIPDKERIRDSIESGRPVVGAEIRPGYQLRTYASRKDK